jgi:succinate dehydrogenase / fumarate reductase flavoprotein subunit
VLLDIQWIKNKIPNAEQHIKRKLPGMYHQFKALADVDITAEPMEVGPTTHYAMGGVRVDADTQMSNVPGLFAAGECAAGLHGANRLGGNSLSDLLVFGERAGRHAADYATRVEHAPIDAAQVERGTARALAPLERTQSDDVEEPFKIQGELQTMMMELVGIVRTGDEMHRAVESVLGLGRRAKRVAAHGNREYNPGWHTALDLPNLLLVAEMIARAAVERRESRGAHFRSDHPDKDPEEGRMNILIRKGDDGTMEIERSARPELRPDLAQIIEEIG